MSDEGVWRTVSGRRIFIAKGQTVTQAMKASGKFRRTDNEIKADLKEVHEQLKKLEENAPERKYDYTKPVDGITEEEWKELSRFEKEMMMDLTEPDKEYEQYMMKYCKLKEKESSLYNEYDMLKKKEFIANGGNTYKDKLPTKAKDKDYDGFSKDTNETHQDFMADKELAKRYGYSEIYIAEMSPDEYLDRCAKEVFNISTTRMINGIPEKENVQKYATMMLTGTKFDMPYIDAKQKQQEGRHRALAAKANGYKTIPVLYLK